MLEVEVELNTIEPRTIHGSKYNIIKGRVKQLWSATPLISQYHIEHLSLTSNHHGIQIRPRHKSMDIKFVALHRHTNLAGLNRIMGPQISDNTDMHSTKAKPLYYRNYLIIS